MKTEEKSNEITAIPELLDLLILKGVIVTIAEKDEWAELHGIGMVKCRRKTKNGESTDVRYFITSLRDVVLSARAMRSHWSVENKLHWVLDTVFDEDYCRVRKDCSTQNLNVIRKITMNLLAATDFSDIIKEPKIPLSHKRTLCIKRENCLLRVLQNL